MPKGKSKEKYSGACILTRRNHMRSFWQSFPLNGSPLACKERSLNASVVVNLKFLMDVATVAIINRWNFCLADTQASCRGAEGKQLDRSIAWDSRRDCPSRITPHIVLILIFERYLPVVDGTCVAFRSFTCPK